MNIDPHRNPATSITPASHPNSAKSFAGRYRCTPIARKSPAATTNPVSSLNSRTAASTNASPASATPFGMSHRAAPPCRSGVACPNSTSPAPSRTNTPQLVTRIATPSRNHPTDPDV